MDAGYFTGGWATNTWTWLDTNGGYNNLWLSCTSSLSGLRWTNNWGGGASYTGGLETNCALSTWNGDLGLGDVDETNLLSEGDWMRFAARGSLYGTEYGSGDCQALDGIGYNTGGVDCDPGLTAQGQWCVSASFQDTSAWAGTYTCLSYENASSVLAWNVGGREIPGQTELAVFSPTVVTYTPRTAVVSDNLTISGWQTNADGPQGLSGFGVAADDKGWVVTQIPAGGKIIPNVRGNFGSATHSVDPGLPGYYAEILEDGVPIPPYCEPQQKIVGQQINLSLALEGSSKNTNPLPILTNFNWQVPGNVLSDFYGDGQMAQFLGSRTPIVPASISSGRTVAYLTCIAISPSISSTHGNAAPFNVARPGL